MPTNTVSKKRILIVGGHLTPALAVIDRIRSLDKPWDIVFVGRRYAFEGKRGETEEYRLVTDRGIPFVELTSGRLQRSLSAETFGSLLKIPFGFVSSWSILERTSPDLVVSFGGYLAVPVVLAAALRHIPVITHEQTRVPGLSNRIIARFARTVLATFPPTGTWGHGKTQCIGLPLRPELFTPPAKPTLPLPPGEKPIIYITGGSTGAVTLNERLMPTIAQLLERYTVVHQTGKLYIGNAQSFRGGLSASVRDRYIPVPYVDAQDVSWLMHHVEMLVGRSGANTVVEAIRCRLPAIYVPLPWSGGNEQYENAKFVADRGAAVVIDQDRLTTETAVAAVERIHKDRSGFVAGAAAVSADIPDDADVRFVTAVDRILTGEMT
jgi:UDP-N-acetylglucosamine--N-acetylmuramyl-(pentapeptide) pyrophosphoryl-undecaprenol N-acetylglucosamine transferase